MRRQSHRKGHAGHNDVGQSQVLLLQEELVDLKKHINETTAGMALYNELLELLEKQKRALGRLESQAQQNPNLAAAVEMEKVRTQANIESIFKQLNALKISFSRKVTLFFKRPPKAVRIAKCWLLMCVLIEVLIASRRCYRQNGRSLKSSVAVNMPPSYLQHNYYACILTLA